MTVRVNRRALALRLRTPQQKNRRLLLGIDSRYHGIGKKLPTFPLMRARSTSLNRQDAIEQQYALPGPLGEIAA